MKYLVVLYDGAADRKIDALGGRTPFEAADKPCLDRLARRADVGTVKTVPDGMVPESDTANLAVMGYDPLVYSKGRSPLEAVSMGLDMQPDQTAFRCNVVALSDESDYTQRTMLDHSADEISTPEADELIKAIDRELGNDAMSFYTGVSYRHCLLWKDAPDFKDFNRPHDIIGRKIAEYLPPEPFRTLQIRSAEILDNHPVNIRRREKGLKAANSIWLWSPGKKPALPSFSERFGLKASVISAVDLIKGIGLCAGMSSIDVPGATGNIHTNFEGKAQAAIEEFKRGADYVYIHVEAPDECGHRAELENKVRSIELIDQKILAPVCDYLESTDERFRVLVMPDHPTPIELRTHSREPVPFMIFDSAEDKPGVESFTEDNAEATGVYISEGYELVHRFIISD